MEVKSVLTLLLAATTLIANPYESKQDEIDAVTAIGKKASSELLKTLGGNLKKHLKSGGPSAALQFCSGNAYALTEKIDESFGADVHVKRVSMKYRNPANAPSKDEEPVLQALHLMNQNGVVPPREVVQDLGNGVYKYYKPLIINKKACLICHGDVQTEHPELYRKIKAVYPDDRATGFHMNDMRGAIVVEIKK